MKIMNNSRRQKVIESYSFFFSHSQMSFFSPSDVSIAKWMNQRIGFLFIILEE